MRAWAATIAAAALAEILAYFLSLTWGFMALLLAFVIVSIRMASNGAKAYATEARVNAILPVLGQHAAAISTAQTAANNAQGTANNANNTANNAQGTANAANNTANNALPASGGTISGGLNVTGGVTIGGSLYSSSGTLTVGSTTVFDQTVTVLAAAGFHAGIDVLGEVGANSLNVGGSNIQNVNGASGYPIAAGTAWGNNVINALNSVYNQLVSSGIF
jgi:hypothetical protein